MVASAPWRQELMAIRTIHVGAWNRARAHLGVMADSEVYEPVALVDPNQEFLAKGRELSGLGEDASYGTLTEALGEHDCDAVVVVTPVMLHAAFIDEALTAGKHVMVEKPFTVNLEDAERAVNTAENKGLQLLVTQNDRLNPVFKTMRRHLEEETFGPPGYAVMIHDKPRVEPYHDSPHMHLWQQGVHQLDTLLATIPCTPVRVRGLSVEPPWGNWPSPSLAHATIEFDDAVSATYVGTSQARHAEFQFTIECADAALAAISTASGAAQASLVLKRGSEVEALDVDDPPEGMTAEEQIADMFARQVLRGEDTELSGRNNLTTMRVVDAVAQSTELGTAIDLS